MASSTPNDDVDVIVVGFGYAGALATNRLRARGRRVLVVEPTGQHQFLTRLAAVAAGLQPIGDAAVDIADINDVAVIRDAAVGRSGTSLALASGRTIDAPAILLTAGARPSPLPIDGLDHALALRSAVDAERIRSEVEVTSSVVIVGGGPTGCQLAGALAMARPSLSITLVEESPRLMAGFGRPLGRRTAEILTERNVQLIHADPVEQIRTDGVTLESGRQIPGLVLAAAGFDADMSAFGPTIDGRLDVDETGRVAGTTTVFAAGDAAAHPDGDGHVLPMSAQIASQAGPRIANNIDAVLNGGSPNDLRLRDRGWVVDLGGAGVAEIFGLPLAHPLTDRLAVLLHDAIDLRHLWQLGGIDAIRRCRVA